MYYHELNKQVWKVAFTQHLLGTGSILNMILRHCACHQQNYYASWRKNEETSLSVLGPQTSMIRIVYTGKNVKFVLLFQRDRIQFFGLPMGLNKLKTEMNKKPLRTKGIQHETHVYHFPQWTRHLVRGWVESCRTSCICYRIAASEVLDTKEPEKTKIIPLSSFLRRQ